MALPTLTWRISTNYAITAAGANPTLAEILAAINTALTTEAAGSGLWEVSHYSAGNGTLEIKRKGSPGGELGTLRILLFGGSAPNASVHVAGHSATNLHLYIGYSKDAGTTGPPVSYTTGIPYTGHWSGATVFASTTSLVTASSPYVYFFDADDVFGMQIGTTTTSSNVVVGRLLTDVSANTAYWAGWGSGATAFVNTFRLTGYINSATAPIPSVSAGAGNQGRGLANLPDGDRAFCAVGAPAYGSNYADIFGNIDLAVLDPVAVGSGVHGASVTYAFQGFMRQIRFGPIAANKAALIDINNVVQAYHIGIGSNGTAAAGFWLDTQI